MSAEVVSTREDPILTEGPDTSSAVQSPVPGRCLLCGTSDAPIVWTEGQHRHRQCSCGVLYLDPQPDLSKIDITRDHTGDGYYRLPARLRFEWLRQFVPHGSLLEVGFSRGHVLTLAHEAGFEVTGVDPNPAAVAQARERGFDVELATIETSALPERSFDVVFHVDLLSHWPDPIAALVAMRRRLRPGGVLVFEVGVIGGLHPRWHRWWGSLLPPEHRTFFSEEAIGLVLERAGLEIVGVKRFGLLASSAVLRVRRLLEGRMDRLARPWDPTGLPPITSGIAALYERAHMFARYRVGARLPAHPALGQLTVFVAAREKNP
jgi:SAM-dependent methyltransferase